MSKGIYQTEFLIKEKNGIRIVVSKILDFLSPDRSSWQNYVNHWKKNGDATNEKITSDIHGVKQVEYKVPGTRMSMRYKRIGFTRSNSFSPQDKAEYYYKRKFDDSLTKSQRKFASKRFEQLVNTGK